MYCMVIFRYGVSCSLRLVLTDLEFLYLGHTLILLSRSVMSLTMYLYSITFFFLSHALRTAVLGHSLEPWPKAKVLMYTDDVENVCLNICRCAGWKFSRCDTSSFSMSSIRLAAFHMFVRITRCAGAFVSCKLGTGLLDENVRRNIDIT